MSIDCPCDDPLDTTDVAVNQVVYSASKRVKMFVTNYWGALAFIVLIGFFLYQANKKK